MLLLQTVAERPARIFVEGRPMHRRLLSGLMLLIAVVILNFANRLQSSYSLNLHQSCVALSKNYDFGTDNLRSTMCDCLVAEADKTLSNSEADVLSHYYFTASKYDVKTAFSKMGRSIVENESNPNKYLATIKHHMKICMKPVISPT